MYDTFMELGLIPEIMKAVKDMGFEEPTPIQKASIPLAMKGKDLIGQAQTSRDSLERFVKNRILSWRHREDSWIT